MCRQGANRVTVFGTTLNSPFFVLAVREKNEGKSSSSENYGNHRQYKGPTTGMTLEDRSKLLDGHDETSFMMTTVPGNPVTPMMSPLLIVPWISSKFCSVSLKEDGRERERREREILTITYKTYTNTPTFHLP